MKINTIDLGENIEVQLTEIFPKKAFINSTNLIRLSKRDIPNYFTFNDEKEWNMCKLLIDNLFYPYSEFEKVISVLNKIDSKDFHFNKNSIFEYITISEFSEYFLRPLAVYVKDDKVVDGIYIYKKDNEDELPLIKEVLSPEYQERFVLNYHIEKMYCIDKHNTGLMMFLAFNKTIHESPHKSKTKYTYVMSDESKNGLFKIGRSLSPINRHLQLKNGNPLLKLDFYIEGDRETELHHIFANKLFDGEWFKLSAKDLKFIRNYNKIRKEHPEYQINKRN